MYFEKWLKVQYDRGFSYQLLDTIYKVETFSLPNHIQNKMAKVWWLYQYMISLDHEPEETWALLNEGYRDMYLEVFKYCKDNGLKNLQRFWGRKYNMCYNIPNSFETYSGRIYEITL